MMLDNVIVTDNNIHITDSAFLSKHDADVLLYRVTADYPTCSVVVNRSHGSMMREWAAHTLLYKLHILRSHTKDVDLNYPQRWWVSLAYNIFGAIALIFLK